MRDNDSEVKRENTGGYTNGTSGSAGGVAMTQDDLLQMIRGLVHEAKVDVAAGSAPSAADMTPQEIERALLEADVSDNGNAICVVMLYPNRFLWVDAFGWLRYHDGFWDAEGAEAALDGAVVETMRRRVIAAFNAGKSVNGERIMKFCTQNANRVNGTKALLKHHVAATVDSFDAHLDLLNVANGVVNLRTGELSPHDPALRFMSRADVAYKSGADPAEFVEWLTATVGGGADTVDWLQMAVGYTLTGHTDEDCMFYLYGPGRSGKGTFTTSLQAILGSGLSKATSFETFTGKREVDAQNFALAPLKTARLVVASETEKNQRLSSAKVKTITGGDQVSCSFKGRDHFNYTPRYKIWLSSNFPVNGDPNDDALWSRVRVVEFPNGHIGKEDRTIKRRITSKPVLEGALAWAVQGAMRWYNVGKGGLPETEYSQRAKVAHRSEQDSVGQWLSECAILEIKAISGSKSVYQSYEGWCRENGFEPLLSKGLTQALKKRGCTTPDNAEWFQGKTQRVIYGIGLLVD